MIGLLAAVGPFAIDMYLPAMPAVAADLGTSPQAVQATLTAYFLAFGLAQMVWGPLSDQIGRRPPLLIGLGIFLLGTLGCMLAPDVASLTAARVVQGVGGATVMVMPRAIIRDLHTGPEATRLMAMVMLVISVSPMLAPLAGSGVLAISGWRAIFGVLAVAAAVSLLLTRFALPETLPPADRRPARIAELAQGLRRLLTDRAFLGLTFTGGFGMASFFVFLASAAFVYTGTFGLSPTGFSIAFAVNALGFFVASQAAASLGERFGTLQVISVSAAGFAAATALLLALTLAGSGGIVTIGICLFIANGFLGLVVPSCMVLALDPHPDIAGLASSLGGTLQMITGGAMITLGAPFFDASPLPMVAIIALCGVLCLGAAMVSPRGARPAEGTIG